MKSIPCSSGIIVEMLRNYFEKKLRERVACGVVVLDKESGITSHDEVNRLRRVFGTRKIGHSGTLDPKVTGVLVCGLGKGTKVLEYVLLSEKVYDCEIVFHKSITKLDFVLVIEQFMGVITQLPPVKSSVKRVEREREIYSIELLSFAEDKRSARMRCVVERGTYIRKLCHDMGERLGCGAHMGDLRRIQAGPCSENNSRLITTTELQGLQLRSQAFGWISWLFGWWYVWRLASHVEPVEKVLQVLPKIVVHNQTAPYLYKGADLYIPGVLSIPQGITKGQTVYIVDQNERVISIGELLIHSDEWDKNDKGIAVKTKKVLL